jgi:hypothetical protein
MRAILDFARQLRGALGQAPMVVPGLYAWLATVASPSIKSDAPSGARLLALGALASLLFGPLIGSQRPFAGRLVLALGFVGLSLATWLVMSDTLTVDRLDPSQAILGGFGWVAFAFSWGSHRRLGVVPEEHPNAIAGERLEARERFPLRSSLLLGMALVGGLAMLALAWAVERPRAGLLAHATALGGAILLLTAGASLAVRPEVGALRPPPDYRLARAARPLAFLAVVLFAGVVWQIVR